VRFATYRPDPAAAMLRGGYRRTYLRALSRLIALAGAEMRQDGPHGTEEGNG
jgi:hypothetical protein